jgi:hypothetical protein
MILERWSRNKKEQGRGKKIGFGFFKEQPFSRALGHSLVEQFAETFGVVVFEPDFDAPFKVFKRTLLLKRSL